MKKWVLLLSVFVCLAVSSCGVPAPPDEKFIAQNIPEEIKTVSIDDPFDAANADVYSMDVKSVSIEKRQTNGKEDTAYCTVEMENDYYCFTKSIVTYYTYYDKGGWTLDLYNEYSPPSWRIKGCPFSKDKVAELVSEHSILNANDPAMDTDSGTVQFTYDVKDEYENLTVEGTVAVNFVFDGSSWKYEVDTDAVELNWNIVGHWYSPIYAGLYLDILELTDDSVTVEVFYEDAAKDALEGEKGALIDISDERFWHLKTQSTDLWKESTSKGEPYLQFRFNFKVWGDAWEIYILKDSAFAQVRAYKNTELYRVDANPFIAD